jgi:hypothetical protein
MAATPTSTYDYCMPTAHSVERLKGAARATTYGLAMLTVVTRLIQREHLGGDPLGVNLLTESDLLHARNPIA